MFAFLKLPPVLERNDGMNSFLCQFDEWPWRLTERRAETKISQWRWKEERQIFVPKRQERGERVGRDPREGPLCVVFRAGRQGGGGSGHYGESGGKSPLPTSKEELWLLESYIQCPTESVRTA